MSARGEFSFDAVVLAGGRAARMGGVAKPALTVGGRSLLGRTVAAARGAGASRVIVAGPPVAGVDDVRWVREVPAFGGPVAGVAAALAESTAPWVMILPADLMHPGPAVAALADEVPVADGACLRDEEGRAQWLTGLFRASSLRRRVAALGAGVRDAPARALHEGLDISPRPGAASAAEDVDTWDHLREARRRFGARKETNMAEDSSRTLPPEALEEWGRALRERFGLAEEDLPIALILDLARDVANGVARPAAPFSAYVAGLVAGRAGGTPEQVRDAVAAITTLAEGWGGR
ncbi:NTP transferase domain-containing protein [Microbacterium lushaniae]|uniref:NTP transferase domain-containing protein n=1 Tax=Microbacterium lushaniae TaxID=2614639 RepID=A0A5J6L428_9MICO|nr:NTP transferase domain-containing protein [Microbacterium lushaniae]QEW03126.1 NTP transferase domain-containing protein [Microbacterium lushaniae]